MPYIQTAEGVDLFHTEYDAFADDLAALIERLDLGDITFVGYSAGCGDIVRYLTRHGSARVARVVLIASTTPLLLKTPDNSSGLDAEILNAGTSALRRDVPQWCTDNAPGFFGQTPASAGLEEWVIRQIVDTHTKVLLDTAAVFASTDFREELRALNVPTLVMHGDLDASAPIDLTGRPTAALIPGARLIVYPGMGHGMFASDHGRLNRDILAFIAHTGVASKMAVPV